MLVVVKDVATGQEWRSFRAYDDTGRLTFSAGPAAVSGDNENGPALVNGSDGQYEFVRR